MVISDNPPFCAYLSRLLSGAGHLVSEISCDGDPVAAVRRLQPEAVLIAVEAARLPALAIDYRLPLSHGGGSIPVLVVSEALELEAELLQVFDFIPRQPLDLPRLREALEALSRPAADREDREALDDGLYREFSSHVLSGTGLLFESRNRSTFERALGRRMAVLRLGSCADYLGYLKRYGDARGELHKLLHYLTVGETYFFRYRAQFDSLMERLLRLPQDRPIRIWSAACSTGEEPYSIAISVMEALPDWRRRDIAIVATDINLHSLRRAAEALYSDWSLRTSEPRLVERYFERRGEGYALKEEVKRLVRFRHLNLCSDSWGELEPELTGLDAVFCRNVLIYFTPEAGIEIVRRIAPKLKPAGLLFLGHAENMLLRLPELQLLRREDSYYYQKIVPPRREPVQLPGEQAPGPGPGPVAVPASREPEPPPRGIAEARALFEAGALDAASQLVECLLEETPDRAEAMVLKGFIEVCRGRLQQALESCNRAIARDDLNAEAYFLKGVVLEGVESFAEAADQYRKALLLDHEFIMPRFHMGRLHLRAGRSHEAAREIRNIIRILQRCSDEGIVPYSGGVSRSVWIEKLETALEQVA